MAFQIKDFRSIVASMINWMKSTTDKITDFNIGSVARTMVEAPAAEMDELYQQILIGLKEAIPVSVFSTFGFTRKPAAAASGIVRFSTGGSLAPSSIIIPAGTVVRVPGTSKTYVTQAPAILQANTSYVDTLVAAQSAGSTGNTEAGTVTEIATPVSGINEAVNPAPFTNGRDEETDDELKTRFQGYISTLARGTKSAIEYGAKTAKVVDADGMTTEYVAHASVVEPYLEDETQPISLVECYVHNGAGATSAALVAEAQKMIDGYIDETGIAVPGWKAAGVKVVVLPAADKAVNVAGEITVGLGVSKSDAIASATDAIRSYIQARNVGEAVLLAEIIAIIKRDVGGVYNVTISAPTGDVICEPYEKAIPGTVALT